MPSYCTLYTLKTILHTVCCIQIFSNFNYLADLRQFWAFQLFAFKSLENKWRNVTCKLSFPLRITTQNTGIISERFLTVPTHWPLARTNSAGSLKCQLQSRSSSVEVWIMWNSTTHQPSSLPSLKQRRRRGTSDQMLASPNAGGQRSWIDSGGRGGFVMEERYGRWARPCSTSSAGDKHTAPSTDLVWFELGLPWRRSANWILPPLINNRWSIFLGDNLFTGNISFIVCTLSGSLFSWHYL